jgi:hypothetical protein
MFGIIYPNQYGIVITLSIMWEWIEGYAVQHPLLYPLLQKYWIIPEKYWNEGFGNKITDIVANISGYICANKVHNSKYIMHFFYVAFILWVLAIIYSKM